MQDLLTNLKTLWTGLPQARRVTLILVAAVVVTLLSVLIFFANRPNYQVLFAKMPSEEAARVMEFLREKKIKHELAENADGTSNIKVPGHTVSELRLQLVQAGIPRKNDTAGGVGFELFDKPTFGMSDFMQKENYKRALQGELARTIQDMDEVENARVMVVIPEERLFSKERRESKASVMIKLKKGRQMNVDRAKAIQMLIASAVEGLQPGKVVIIDNTGRSLTDEDSAGGIGAMSTAQLKIRNQEESLKQEKAQSMLDQVLGYGQAIVKVNADMDFDSVQQTSEKFDPKGQVPRQESVNNENIQSKTEALSGVAGTQPNTEQRSSADSGATTSSSQVRENLVTNYDINRVVETRQRAPGEIKRLTVAVFLNIRKTGTGATASMQPRTPQEKEELERVVKSAVGFMDGRDAIQTSEAPFVGGLDESSETVEERILGVPNKILPYVSQAFLIAAAIALIFYLRHILKATSDQKTDAAGEFASLLGRYKRLADDALAEANRDKNPPPFLTAEELGKLIRDNPGNTSQAIRVWLSRN
jgi:flagellar M-ring protein FliF